MDRGRSIHVPAFFQIVFGNQAKTRLETFVILLTQVFDEYSGVTTYYHGVSGRSFYHFTTTVSVCGWSMSLYRVETVLDSAAWYPRCASPGWSKRPWLGRRGGLDGQCRVARFQAEFREASRCCLNSRLSQGLIQIRCNFCRQLRAEDVAGHLSSRTLPSSCLKPRGPA